jgi:hypothetical protein
MKGNKAENPAAELVPCRKHACVGHGTPSACDRAQEMQLACGSVGDDDDALRPKSAIR